MTTELRESSFYVCWKSDSLSDEEAKQHLDRIIRQSQVKIASRTDISMVEDGHKTISALIVHTEDCRCEECTGVAPPPLPPEPVDPLDYFRAIIRNGGGMITLPDQLGFFVGPDPKDAPAGWFYLPVEGLTAEALKAHVDEARKHKRTDWPKPD
jgi:hypothetical protein